MTAINAHLQTLAVAAPDVRRAALEQVLSLEKLEFSIQAEELSEENPRPAQNYLLLPEGDEAFPLFCAHYDSYPGSVGANDNAAAVCILIALAQTLRERHIRAGFAFFDGEEKGHSGAKLFCSTMQDINLSAVLNLDMCGYGDTIAVYSSGSTRKAAIKTYCNTAFLKKHNGTLVKYLPESDNVCFRNHKQPVLNLAVVPKWDLSYLNALSSYQGSFLGRPPEFYMMLNQLEVASTMHGAFRDEVKWVEPSAMEQMYQYLLEACTGDISL